MLKPLGVLRHGVSPNKLYDYLASRKPTLVATGAVNDIVRDARAGLSVEPGSAEALAEGILKLYRLTPEERRQLGANGRSYVEKHHDIRMLGQRLAEVVEVVADAP